ncbi:hypothetical protein [Roseovarius sp. MMSF_3281]|uniref:hypothetical protein n=1 Tax=Roseovarius sp. MMSF_3281 TaxID=3046694 RepID=UPI00273EFF8B|nr:hypothetical protein [Roseovarius sp. MMSF_3281]
MAIEIGALRALLSLDSAAFERGAKRAQASMNGLQRRLTKASRNMRGIGKKMSLGITAPMVAMGGAALRSSMQTVDAQSKMAQSLNTSTKSMQVLARAADRAGVSTGELEQIGRQLTKRLGDAAQGTGPAVKALARLGLKAEDLADMDLDQKIAVINRAIADTVPAAEQAAVAADLFGDRAGIAAGRMDAATIAAANEELERFGVTVTELEADQIEEANDAISALGLVSRGLANQLAVALAPTLKRMAEWLADLGAKFSALSPRMQRIIGIGAALAASIGPVVFILGAMAAGLAALASPLGAVVLGIAAAAGAAAALWANWDRLVRSVPGVVNAMGNIKSRNIELNTRFWELVESTRTWVDLMRDSISQGDYAGAIQRVTEAMASVPWHKPEFWTRIGDAIDAGAARAGLAAFNLGNAVIDWLGEGLSNLPARMAQFGADLAASIRDSAAAAISAALDIGRNIVDGIKAGIDEKWEAFKARQAKRFEGLSQSIKDVFGIKSPSRVFMRIGRDLMAGLGLGIEGGSGGPQAALQRAADQLAGAVDGAGLLHIPQMLGQGFAGAFKSAITGAKSLGRALKDFVGNALSQISNQLISAGIGSFGFGGGAASGILGAFAGLFDNGGFIPSGKIGRVAERGTELVNGVLVPGPAHVTSRAATERMMDRAGGGAAPQLTYAPVIDARGADPSTVARIDAQLQQQAREFEGKVFEAMVNAKHSRHSRAWEGES